MRSAECRLQVLAASCCSGGERERERERERKKEREAREREGKEEEERTTLCCSCGVQCPSQSLCSFLRPNIERHIWRFLSPCHSVLAPASSFDLPLPLRMFCDPSQISIFCFAALLRTIVLPTSARIARDRHCIAVASSMPSMPSMPSMIPPSSSVGRFLRTLNIR